MVVRESAWIKGRVKAEGKYRRKEKETENDKGQRLETGGAKSNFKFVILNFKFN